MLRWALVALLGLFVWAEPGTDHSDLHGALHDLEHDIFNLEGKLFPAAIDSEEGCSIENIDVSKQTSISIEKNLVVEQPEDFEEAPIDEDHIYVRYWSSPETPEWRSDTYDLIYAQLKDVQASIFCTPLPFLRGIAYHCALILKGKLPETDDADEQVVYVNVESGMLRDSYTEDRKPSQGVYISYQVKPSLFQPPDPIYKKGYFGTVKQVWPAYPIKNNDCNMRGLPTMFAPNDGKWFMQSKMSTPFRDLVVPKGKNVMMHIPQLARQYLTEHPSYNVIGSNCQDFAKFMYNALTGGDASVYQRRLLRALRAVGIDSAIGSSSQSSRYSSESSQGQGS